MKESQQNAGQQAGLWIYNPSLDLIVGCGAWSAPLLLISYLSQASSARAWALAFYVLAFFFNYPHYMATIYRAYHRAEDFQKYRIFTVHITALIALTALVSHFWVGLLPWIFTIYLTWSPWHYSGQNYGLFMMFARRAGAEPSQDARRALYGAFIVSYAILFLGFHTGPSTDPLFLSLGIPASYSRVAQVVLCVAFGVLSSFGLSELARITGWRKLIPSLTLFSSQFLWFLLPAVISLFHGSVFPQSRYSNGVLAVMHSAQYLWITSYYARREATGQARPKERRNWRPLAYFGVLIAGGIALFVPGPWLASRAFHFDFTTSFLIFGALVNIHHFILDGAIWKLRDGRIASLLLNSRERVSEAALEARGQAAALFRWIAGDTAGAHRLRVSAAFVLLTLGAVDQARYYLALHGTDLRDLQRAAALDAFDSPLQMKLARKEMEEGKAREAEASWKRAMQGNPADPAPRQGLLRLLLDQKRFDEALQLTEASLKYQPKDANLLVDHGLLELQFGETEAALADWKKAVAIDPSQPMAHLYLAHELDREGKAQDAATQYEAYLQRIARQSAQDRPKPDLLIGIVLRMADCQAHSSEMGAAVKSFEMAGRLAEETGQAKLESAAAINEADLQGAMGNANVALTLYQRALKLDESTKDSGASALDWFSYGRFLDHAGFPARLAYASLVKSELAEQSASEKDRLASNDAARSGLEKELEDRLGVSTAKLLRRSPDSAAQEALALRH